MVRRRFRTARVLAIVRQVAPRLGALRTSREWRSIATPERLVWSLGTLAAELGQAVEEDADESAVLPLVAEIVVVATELSFGFGEEFFGSAVEKEVSRREDLAGWSGLATSPAARVSACAVSGGTTLMPSDAPSARTPI
jgi:hypothetical protein